MKKLISLILAAAMLCGSLALSAWAQDESASGTLKLVNYNVAGLSLPSFITPDKPDTKKTTQVIGQYFKDYDYDVLCVQEDFDYHFTLTSTLQPDYKTYWNGGMGIGSGLNLFSRYKLYDAGRVPWDVACGVLDRGSDELTPKGIVYATIELAPGAYVDIYDIHADAYEDTGSVDAKYSQFKQLYDLIASRNTGHAVIVTGDFNTYFTMDYETVSSSGQTRPGRGVYLRQLFHDDGGFDEAWIEACFDGNYNFTAADVYARYANQYSDQWGNYDSAEKMFYRGSDAVTFSTVSHEYRWIKDAQGGDVSDHAAQLVTLAYTINTGACKTEKLTPNWFNPFSFVYHYLGNMFHTVWLLLCELPALIRGEITVSP